MSNKRDKNKAARIKRNRQLKRNRKLKKDQLPKWKTDSNGNKIKLEWS